MLPTFQPSPQQVKILVVDDQRLTAQALAGLLEAEGYQVSIAGSGEKALEMIPTEKPSVVLLDVMMPGMNGFEVCRRIKGNPETTFLPVILITGLGDAAHRVEGAAAGADDFITKPPDEQELLARIRSLARVRFLHGALEASYGQVQALLAERTRQLGEAMGESQQLLQDKARFAPGFRSTPPRDDLAREGRSLDQTRTAEDDGASPTDRQSMRRFKKQLMGSLSGLLEGRADLTRTPELVGELSQRLATIYSASGLGLADQTRKQLFTEILDDILGYGPIEPLLHDPTITEVMVNGPHSVYVERGGRLTKTAIQFDDDDHVLHVIDRIIRPLGRRVDRNSPMVDARLPDGSRVNAIISPCALDGPSITIRRFPEKKLTAEDLINFGTLTPKVAEFLGACVRSRLNIILSGGTGSGKTTSLNVLSSFIPAEERIVTIEDSAELQLHQDHVMRMEAKPAEPDGTGEVPIRQLVKNALRMRPDRIVVGEVRGGEALDMLQAMNTGHDGSLTTIHANTPRDTLARLETLVLMAGMDLPLQAVRAQIASALDLIVQQARIRDGSRKIVNISEVQGMEGDVIVMSDIFVFKDEGTEDGRVIGSLSPTGVRPKFSPKLEIAGFHLPGDMYVPRPRGSEQSSGRRRTR